MRRYVLTRLSYNSSRTEGVDVKGDASSAIENFWLAYPGKKTNTKPCSRCGAGAVTAPERAGRSPGRREPVDIGNRRQPGLQTRCIARARSLRAPARSCVAAQFCPAQVCELLFVSAQHAGPAQSGSNREPPVQAGSPNLAHSHIESNAKNTSWPLLLVFCQHD